MRIVTGEASIELNNTETDHFTLGEFDTRYVKFRNGVLGRADKLANETERTVIIASPDIELGTYSTVRGWFSPQWIDIPSGIQITEEIA